jgi:predicted O-linked N-acetylglucosamine transferase (SPINDLY family)
MIGVCQLQAGRLDDGIAALGKALMLAPANAMILNHLGVALCQAGRGNEGISSLEKAVRLAPAMAEARNNLAHALNDAGRHAEAAQHYRLVVERAPGLVPAGQGLASALHKSGDIAAARQATEEAIARFPGHAPFHASLGRILIDQHHTSEAEAAFRRALAIDPNNGEAANNLGTLIEEDGQLREALELYRAATQTRPDLADGWFNLGNVAEKLGDLAAARTALEKASSLRPASARTLAALIGVRRKLCDWTGLDDEVARLCGLLNASGARLVPEDAPPPFAMLSLMVGAGLQKDVARAHSRQVMGKASGWSDALAPWNGDRPPLAGRKLKIGYLSPDFREHPIAQLMAGVLEHHDRDQFEVSAWSLGPDDQSRYRARIIAAADRFEDLRALDIADIVTQMRSAELDIVVDLAGYTAHARPEILALRTAPVQVNYLGFPGTMGAGFIDYIIADGTVLPEGDERFYTERVIRLPGCYQANDDRAEIDDAAVGRAEFGLPEDAFVFCCFSMNYKIDPSLMDAWAEILSGSPKAVLWLFRTDPAAADNLLREAQARGIAAERLIFADRLPKPRHLARHRLADLFLDSFSYGAHTTASDALWAGLPVLTLHGDTFARRVGASIVRAANMADLVVSSVADYVTRAKALAADPGAASDLKRRLASEIARCPLFSTAAIARNLEASYWQMAGQAATGEVSKRIS